MNFIRRLIARIKFEFRMYRFLSARAWESVKLIERGVDKQSRDIIRDRWMNNSPIDFSCRACGRKCDGAPDPPARAICPNCCDDHDYVYEPSLARKVCKDCGDFEPLDCWGDDWA